MEASNANAEAFRDCLYALEARQAVIMMAIDTLGERVGLKVDWHRLEEDFVQSVEQEATAKKAAAEHPEEAVIFGG